MVLVDGIKCPSLRGNRVGQKILLVLINSRTVEEDGTPYIARAGCSSAVDKACCRQVFQVTCVQTVWLEMTNSLFAEVCNSIALQPWIGPYFTACRRMTFCKSVVAVHFFKDGVFERCCASSVSSLLADQNWVPKRRLQTTHWRCATFENNGRTQLTCL
jgi:hypothetical protein